MPHKISRLIWSSASSDISKNYKTEDIKHTPPQQLFATDKFIMLGNLLTDIVNHRATSFKKCCNEILQDKGDQEG